MAQFLNLIYYFYFRLEYRLDVYIDRSLVIFRPLGWLLEQIPFVRARFVSQYGSVENAHAAMRKYREKQLCGKLKEYKTSRIAETPYYATLLFFFWGVYFIVCHYVGQSSVPSRSNFIIGGVCSLASCLLVTHLASSRKDRYKRYFKKFDKIVGIKRHIYRAIALITPITSFAFWLWAMGFAHRNL